MKLKDLLLTVTSTLIVVILALWIISQTKIFALQKIDKDFVQYQVGTIETSVSGMEQQVQALNQRLESLEQLNQHLVEFNTHLKAAEIMAHTMQDSVSHYEGFAKNLVDELRDLNQNLSRMHKDQSELLNTMNKLQERLKPFLGGDD